MLRWAWGRCTSTILKGIPALYQYRNMVALVQELAPRRTRMCTFTCMLGGWLFSRSAHVVELFKVAFATTTQESCVQYACPDTQHTLVVA